MTVTPRRKTPEYYLERAVECERLADSALSAETRETMLYMAMPWQALAAEHGPELTVSKSLLLSP
jgi:uncharacterized protein YeaC (DUF1315 family)